MPSRSAADEGVPVEAQWKRIGASVVCRDREHRVLLTRFECPGHPDSGGWTLPGGGVEWGETVEAAAVRELAEESGLVAELGSVLGMYSRWYTAEEAFLGVPGHRRQQHGRRWVVLPR